MKKSQIKNHLFKLVISGLCFTSVFSSTSCFAAIVKEYIDLTIESGTYELQPGTAVVTYDNSKITRQGNEVISNGTSITFYFLGKTVTGHPTIFLKDGNFEKISWVSSIQNNQGQSFNFGFNDGFSYFPKNTSFGYLSPYTFVDGFGIVTYHSE